RKEKRQLRQTMYLGTQCYQKQTFLLQVELLARLESEAKKNNQSISETLNTILNKELSNNV
ncbi:hypothetical protein, partial [Stutzerimonas stutzeri]|uniref:hypothetical protein n=1 Tax=Stutzerimonas stutzeri TaxID=316 RepID=UPI003EBC5D72